MRTRSTTIFPKRSSLWIYLIRLFVTITLFSATTSQAEEAAKTVSNKTLNCPEGTKVVSVPGEINWTEEWCEKTDSSGEALWQGPYRIVDPTGKLIAEEIYNNDRPDGPATIWHSNGNVQGKGEFRNGQKEGKWTEWYEDGKTKKEEGEFRGGKKRGKWTEWHMSGELSKTTDFGEVKAADAPKNNQNSSSKKSEIFVGKVIDVLDGDQVEIEPKGEKKSRLISLYGIDAPELDQPYGKKAREFLKKLLLGKQVSVEVKGRTFEKQTVGLVTTSTGENVSHEMLKAGFAWHVIGIMGVGTNVTEARIYRNRQDEARKIKAGLWAGKERLRPFSWRSSSSRKQSVRTEKEKECTNERQACPGHYAPAKCRALVYDQKTGEKKAEGRVSMGENSCTALEDLKYSACVNDEILKKETTTCVQIKAEEYEPFKRRRPEEHHGLVTPL